MGEPGGVQQIIAMIDHQPHRGRDVAAGQGMLDRLFNQAFFGKPGAAGHVQSGDPVRTDLLAQQEHVLPDVVRDIWMRDNYVYVVLGEAGLRIVAFDPGTQTLSEVAGGAYDTPGFANAVVMAWSGNEVFIADGDNGIIRIDVTPPESPGYGGRQNFAGFARELWVINDSTLIVAADTAGIYTVKWKRFEAPQMLDSLSFHPFFDEQLYPEISSYPTAHHVLVAQSQSTAFVADGWGGLRIVDVSDPANLDSLSMWPTNRPIEVRDVWVTNDTAYLACGEKGLYWYLDVNNPADPGIMQFLPEDTEGFTSALMVEQGLPGAENDTAFVADGYNGHFIADVKDGTAPVILKSFTMADMAYDLSTDGHYYYFRCL